MLGIIPFSLDSLYNKLFKRRSFTLHLMKIGSTPCYERKQSEEEQTVVLHLSVTLPQIKSGKYCYDTEFVHRKRNSLICICGVVQWRANRSHCSMFFSVIWFVGTHRRWKEKVWCKACKSLLVMLNKGNESWLKRWVSSGLSRVTTRTWKGNQSVGL